MPLQKGACRDRAKEICISILADFPDAQRERNGKKGVISINVGIDQFNCSAVTACNPYNELPESLEAYTLYLKK